jgi:magnesium transporter
MEGELSHQKQIASLIGPDLQRLLKEVGDPELARELVEDFHPEDLADLLRELEDEDAAAFLKALPDDLAAPIFERLEQPTQSVIINLLGPEEAAEIASEMSPDDRADLLEALPDEVGERLIDALEKVDPEAARELESLGRFEESTAGALMTPDYLSASPRNTVADTIQMIRKKGGQAETVYYVFVVNEQNRLEGVVSLRDLLLAESNELIAELMTTRVISVHPETDQEEVARQMSKYDLLAMPVVDKYQTIIGVITADDIMDVLTEEGTEDVQKLGGMEALEASYFATSFSTFLRKRATWLVVLFVGEFFTGTALRGYDEVLGAVGNLAYYLPLLISAGGNSGSQSSTLIIRGMAVGDVKLSDWWRIGVRELGIGIALGVILALVSIGRVLLWGDSGRFAFVVAISVIGIVVMGCVVGAMFPILLRRLGLDPATSSAPFIASLVDVLGILIYMQLAKIVLSGVIEEAVKAKAAAGH